MGGIGPRQKGWQAPEDLLDIERIIESYPNLRARVPDDILSPLD